MRNPCMYCILLERFFEKIQYGYSNYTSLINFLQDHKINFDGFLRLTGAELEQVKIWKAYRKFKIVFRTLLQVHARYLNRYIS